MRIALRSRAISAGSSSRRRPRAEGDAELRTGALDTIDDLARLQVYGLDKALAAFER
jgi:hypothetical protein